MVIYIDNEYKCFTNEAEGYTAVETAFFDGKCAEFIEGYRFIPLGATWEREDGRVFKGEMATPLKNYEELEDAQKAYDLAQLEDMKAALALLGVTDNE